MRRDLAIVEYGTIHPSPDGLDEGGNAVSARARLIDGEALQQSPDRD
jgi:hypothetical protein